MVVVSFRTGPSYGYVDEVVVVVVSFPTGNSGPSYGYVVDEVVVSFRTGNSGPSSYGGDGVGEGVFFGGQIGYVGLGKGDTGAATTGRGGVIVRDILQDLQCE